jgi:carbonic anhydrase
MYHKYSNNLTKGFICRKLKTWESALQELKDGNARFTGGLRSIQSLSTYDRLPELAEKGQKPFAIILSCSDSRVPAEIVFDQGAGDLFMVRVAGNTVAPSLLASMEFAATNFESPLILVMGHTNCGAVNAAIKVTNDKVDPASLGKNLGDLISRITPSVRRVANLKYHENFNDLCTHENVKHSIETILDQSEIIFNLVQQSKLKILGAVFDLKTGKVDFQNI